MLNLFGVCTCTSSALFGRRLCSAPRLRCPTLRGFRVREDIFLRAPGKPLTDAFAYTSSTNHISADFRARGSHPLISPHNGETPVKEIETDTSQPVTTALATIAPGPEAEDVTTTATSVLADECLLREIQKIRHLFGYFDASQEPSRTEVSGFGQTLPNSLMKDVLLVAIDIDTWQGYGSLDVDPELHIGISILDTRLLHTLAPEAACELEPIESYQFVVGNSEYCRRASRRFLFGKSQSISVPELNIQFESLIHSKNRDIVLVLHGGIYDLKALRYLGIDLQPLYIIDTAVAAQSPLDLPGPVALRLILRTFDIPYKSLHAAGNDAHYALRSLLMIATADAECMGLHLPHKTVLTNIANGQIWMNANPEASEMAWEERQAERKRAEKEKRRAARIEQQREKQRVKAQEYAARMRRAKMNKYLSEKEGREKKEQRAKKRAAKEQRAAEKKRAAERKRVAEMEQVAEEERAAEKEKAAERERNEQQERNRQQKKAARRKMKRQLKRQKVEERKKQTKRKRQQKKNNDYHLKKNRERQNSA